MGNSQFVADRFPPLQGAPPTSFLRLNFIDNGDGTCTAYVEDRTNADAVSTPGAVLASGLKIVGTASGGVTGTGTTGRLTKWTNGPASIIGDSLLNETGGNIVQVTGKLLGTTGTVSNPTIAFSAEATTGMAFQVAGVVSLVTAGVEKLRATATGNVFVFHGTGGLALGNTGSSLVLSAQTDGVLTMTNAATTGFGRINLGPATALFPALKRSTTTVQVRLADDSAFAPASASQFIVNGSSSGAITIQGAAAAGTWSLTLPVDDGTPNQFLQTDGNGVTSWQTVTATTPGGADTQVQFNDGGVFGGDADFTWNKTTNTLSVATAYTITGVDWTIQNSSGFELVAAGSAFLRALSGGSAGELRIAGLLGFATGNLNVTAPDAGISRLGAAALAIGNGSSGSFAGSLKLTDLFTNNATFVIRTNTTLTNNAAAQAGTLLNAPTAGNPTKWIGIDDNGTTRYIPAW